MYIHVAMFFSGFRGWNCLPVFCSIIIFMDFYDCMMCTTLQMLGCTLSFQPIRNLSVNDQPQQNKPNHSPLVEIYSNETTPPPSRLAKGFSHSPYTVSLHTIQIAAVAAWWPSRAEPGWDFPSGKAVDKAWTYTLAYGKDVRQNIDIEF